MKHCGQDHSCLCLCLCCSALKCKYAIDLDGSVSNVATVFGCPSANLSAKFLVDSISQICVAESLNYSIHCNPSSSI